MYITGVKVKCPIGTFAASEGSPACDQCTPGYYCETEGLVSVTRDCWLGHYCPEGETYLRPD